MLPLPKMSLATGKPPLAPAVHRPSAGAFNHWTSIGPDISNQKMRVSSNLMSHSKVTPDQRMKQNYNDSDESLRAIKGTKVPIGNLTRSTRVGNEDNSSGGY